MMDVSRACLELHRNGLVQWSSGNASERYTSDEMAIKPSGVRCADVLSTDLVAVRLATGKYVSALPALKPSTDSETHRYIYNALPEINGIVHTHSTYATAFAVAHMPIPCCMTMMADEFGGDVPVGQKCDIGDDSIGKEVVRIYRMTGRPAMLIAAHGVFTVGKTLEAAVKAAVLCEEVAKVAWIAGRMGNIFTLSQEETGRHHKRYTESYGPMNSIIDTALRELRARMSTEWWRLRRKWLLFLYGRKPDVGIDFVVGRAGDAVRSVSAKSSKDGKSIISAIMDGRLDEWCDTEVALALAECRRKTWLSRIADYRSAVRWRRLINRKATANEPD